MLLLQVETIGDYFIINFVTFVWNEKSITVFFHAANVADMDLSNSIKNGILYMEDPIDHV